MKRKAQKAYRKSPGSKALWVATLMGNAQCQPQNVINMPALDHHEIVFSLQQEKQKCIRDFTCLTKSDCAPPGLPFPDYSPYREELSR